MTNVRVWFKKQGATIYISHLDLNRIMIRAIQKSKIPIWHTEGYNPHPFITFALPLSLGFEGMKESMDMKLIEEVSTESVIEKLNEALPKGIEVYDITIPKMKPGKIHLADFSMEVSCDDCNAEELYTKINDVIEQENILIEKKTKKGIKEIDIKPAITKYTTQLVEDNVIINITLPAGSVNNTNPMLLIKAIENKYNIELFTRVKRLEIYNDKGEIFE